MITLAPLLCLTGVLTIALGILHFFLHILFDFKHAIPREGAPLEPLRLGPVLYHTARRPPTCVLAIFPPAISFPHFLFARRLEVVVWPPGKLSRELK